MELEMQILDVKGMEWGDSTGFRNGILYVNKVEALEVCGEFAEVNGFNLYIARPSENIRIIPVKCVVEPRCKISETGAGFPGLVGPIEQAGEGSSLTLKGAAVVMTQSNDPENYCKTGGFIDMTGPGAGYSPYSKSFLLVVDAKAIPSLFSQDQQALDDAVRIAGLRLASYLAKKCITTMPDRAKTYKLDKADESLPGVVYVLQLLAQNPIVEDFYVYGSLAGSHFMPTLMHPNEILDGAVTNFIGSHCTVTSDKQYLYDIQNSPVIEELYNRHGKDLRFLGVIVHNQVMTLEGKERCSYFTSKIAKMLGAKGAVMVTEGHGNPDEDIMLNVRNLERNGCKVVIISDELGGVDGKSPGLSDWVPECNAMVSVGNTHALLSVPAKMERLIGNESSQSIIRASVDKESEETNYILVQLSHVAGSCSQAGIANISARWV